MSSSNINRLVAVAGPAGPIVVPLVLSLLLSVAAVARGTGAAT